MAKAKAPAKFDLKAKVGPGTFKQPVWVWVVVGVGGYYIYKRATGATGATTDTGTSTDAGSYYDAGYAGSGGTGSGAGGFTSDGGSAPPVDPYVDPGLFGPPVPAAPPGGGGTRKTGQRQARKVPHGYHINRSGAIVKNRGRRHNRPAVTG